MKGLKETLILDSEALVLVVDLLVAVTFLNLIGKSIILFYNNMPIVCGIRRLASKLKYAVRLMGILEILIIVAEITPLITLSIEELLNKEAG